MFWKDRIIVASTCRRSTVWLLRNLSLDGELFLRDGKNAAFVKVYHLSPLQWSLENVTICVNPLFLGTMSASADIENLA